MVLQSDMAGVLTLDENVLVAERGDWGLFIPLERVEAILALDGPLLGRRGCHGGKLCSTKIRTETGCLE